MINLKSLKTALRNLPKPLHEGEIFYSELPDRVQEINFEREPYKFGDEIKNVAVKRIRVIAVKYCYGRECWLEWELDV